jgi:hypothetical protein
MKGILDGGVGEGPTEKTSVQVFPKFVLRWMRAICVAGDSAPMQIMLLWMLVGKAAVSALKPLDVPIWLQLVPLLVERYQVPTAVAGKLKVPSLTPAT